MKLITVKDIKEWKRRAEKDGMFLYIEIEDCGQRDVWTRVYRVTARNNRSANETYAIVETLGGMKITVRENGAQFDVR